MPALARHGPAGRGRAHRGRRLAAALVTGFVIAALACPPGPLAAQGAGASAQDSLVRVVLVDGSTIVGRIIESDSARVVLIAVAGARFELPRAQIRSIGPVAGRVVNGEVWPEDANRTRLFFAPTGRALGPGRGYVGVYELFFSFAAVGVGQRVTLAAGTPILPELIGEVFYLAPKLTLVNGARVQVAAGALAFFITRAIDEGSVGIVYGVATLGNADDAVTIGSGWGFALLDAESGLGNEALLLVGLEKRVSRGIKLLSENYVVHGNGLVTGGIRALGERFSGDVGLGVGVGGDGPACCLPIVTVAWRF